MAPQPPIPPPAGARCTPPIGTHPSVTSPAKHGRQQDQPNLLLRARLGGDVGRHLMPGRAHTDLPHIQRGDRIVARRCGDTTRRPEIPVGLQPRRRQQGSTPLRHPQTLQKRNAPTLRPERLLQQRPILWARFPTQEYAPRQHKTPAPSPRQPVPPPSRNHAEKSQFGARTAARQRLRAAAHSVSFGCPGPACLSHRVRLAASTRYQIRPALVTSYCHCSMSTPR